GYEIALDLAKTGCHVILAVRNESKGSEAAEKIKSLSGNSRVDVMIVDMSRIASVQTFANAFAARKLPLHVLVHNAGAPSERVQMSEEGLEENMALNYTSVVLLTSLLLPVMNTSTPSARVVLVSSSAHFQGKREVALSLADCEQQISGWVLYGSSKLNLTAYGESLAKKLSQAKSMVSVCSLDPGFVATPFYTKELPFPISIFAKLVSLHGKTPEEGAHSALYACLSKEPLPNGTYLADTLESTPSVRVRDAAFQEELMRNTTTKLQKVAPWWDGKWF
ncbi:DHRSX, partial [Symbiodinium microadriaticum]